MYMHEDELRLRLKVIERGLALLLQFHNIEVKQEKIIMKSLDDILAGVQAERDADASLIKLVSTLQADLAEVVPPGTLTPAQQAKVDAIFGQITLNITAVNEAINAVPPAPVPVEPPPPVSSATDDPGSASTISGGVTS